MYRLHCVAQSYDWGKPGATSAVADLKAKGEGFAVDPAKPYAEYWFGTHPSGPSKIVVGDGEVLLQDWLLANADALGLQPYNDFSALPYLLKVLSIAKALSVQAHPDRALAQRLHAARPDLYKDANHKPEMACALTPFEAMCSFRPPGEIAAHVRGVPELAALLGEHAAPLVDAAARADADPAHFRAALRAAYSAFMTASDAAVAAQTAALAARLEASVPSDVRAGVSADAVVLRLLAQFPGDVGVLSPYLLNVVALAPGDAIFLGANEPHAYLAGDCVEVMACSDNVVRAGLTPKFKDTAVLCEMLTYATGRPTVLQGERVDACTRSYAAPVPEFELQHTHVGAAHGAYDLPAPCGAAIIVVTAGRGTARVASPAASSDSVVELSEGQVWLQAASASVAVTAPDGVTLFRAFANPRLPHA